MDTENTTVVTDPNTMTEQEKCERLIQAVNDAIGRRTPQWRREVCTELLAYLREHGDTEGVYVRYSDLMETVKPFGRENYPVNVAQTALEAVLADANSMLDAGKEVKRLGPECLVAADRILGPKGRAVVGMLDEIASLDGVNIDVDLYRDKVASDYRHPVAIDSACEEFADDPDMQTIAKAYRLTRQILQREG